MWCGLTQWLPGPAVAPASAASTVWRPWPAAGAPLPALGGAPPRRRPRDRPGGSVRSTRAPWDVAGPLVEVRQQVPLPDVAVGGVPECLGRARRGQHGDGAVEVAGVGQRRRGDDPSLGEHVGVGRAVPELAPQLRHPLRLVQRPLAVHEHGQVLRRVAQGPEGLQVAGGVAPATAAVGGQAGELPHGGHAGCLVGDRLDGAERILVAAPFVGAVGGLGSLDEMLSVAGRRRVGRVADLGRDLGGEEGAAGHRRSGRPGGRSRPGGPRRPARCAHPASATSGRWRVLPLVASPVIAHPDLNGPGRAPGSLWLPGSGSARRPPILLVSASASTDVTVRLLPSGERAGTTPGHVAPLGCRSCGGPILPEAATPCLTRARARGSRPSAGRTLARSGADVTGATVARLCPWGAGPARRRPSGLRWCSVSGAALCPGLPGRPASAPRGACRALAPRGFGTRPGRPGVWLGASRLTGPRLARPRLAGPRLARPWLRRPRAPGRTLACLPASTRPARLAARRWAPAPRWLARAGAPIWPRRLLGHRAILRGGRLAGRRGRRPDRPTAWPPPRPGWTGRFRRTGTAIAAEISISWDEAGRPRIAADGGGNDEDPLEPELGGGLRHEKSRRRPTLPGGLPPSTIGAGGLNCRVRNGNGCFPAAMATGNLRSAGSPAFDVRRREPRLAASPQPLSVPKRARARVGLQALGRLVPVG